MSMKSCSTAAPTGVQNAGGNSTNLLTFDDCKLKQRCRTSRGSPVPLEAGRLRRFSLMVCQSVKARGRTTYIEVADELVADSAGQYASSKLNVEEKNIRRRVYDALNVLIALGIVKKDGKIIYWSGFPEHLAAAELRLMEHSREEQRIRIERKQQKLKEMMSNVVTFQRLVALNIKRSSEVPPTSRIQMPFLLCSTASPATVDCELEDNHRQAALQFTSPFAIYEDTQVLRAMGLHSLEGDLGDFSPDNLRRMANISAINPDKHHNETSSLKTNACPPAWSTID